MDELTAYLNSVDTNRTDFDTTATTTEKETTMENTTTTQTQTTDYTQLTKEELIALLVEADRKMANAGRNYKKLYDLYQGLKAQQPKGMVAVQAPRTTAQASRAAYEATLTTILPIGQPASTAHCPTCGTTVRTNNRGKCVTCSNNAVRAHCANRYANR
jgi:hypothetical protein